MYKLRALGFVALVLFSVAILTTADTGIVTNSGSVSVRQQIVETVDIQGNRRLRDEDLLYYIRTRAGDTYDPAALERDLKELLSLNFFDKTATRVLTEDGIRGGVNVIFEVRELPIIRDLQFKGSGSLTEADILKTFRERRVGISKESVFDPVKTRVAVRTLREMLAAKGYPNATITVAEDEVSATSIALTFNIDQGNRSRIIEIDFEGNQHFSDGELRGALQYVKETGLVSRFKGMDILHLEKLEADLQRNVRAYMWSKGYFQARIGEPQVVGLGLKRTGFPILKTFPLPLVTSTDDTLKVIVPVTEGKVFRVGELKVQGNSIFSEQQILGFVGLKVGEVANGKRLQDAVYEDLKKVYGDQGFVQYSAEFDPVFKDHPTNPNEGIVDITINIDEGKQFTLRRLEFTGNTFTRDKVMRREFLLNEGDIYNQRALDISIARLNQTQYFDPLDKDQDVEIRTAEEQGDVDLIVKVKEKGRQQISFNGGISGIGGSFFGLEYSTNNLAGRGEVLSFNVGAGNRQQSLQFSYQEPYFRDRPISVGFSVFASRYRFFGEGTYLTQNQDLLDQLFDPLGQIQTDESFLFTQKTYGANVFATAPLSELFFKKRQFTQFSRIGLTYQISATSIADPDVNKTGDPSQVIPVIYETPNILTSRITGTFVYDTRQPSSNGIDTARGKSLSISLGFAGLGGDVRTYSPALQYSHFIPVRNKRSQNPHVLAYRILASTVGSWSISDKIRNANSISFIGGVPAYERFFLGSENDLRGYESRAISPVAPFDTYITSRAVAVANNAAGGANLNTGLNARDSAELATLGLVTGYAGANPALFSRNYRFIGGDTQLLANVEYRIPIFGPATMAFFGDIGSVFNLRKADTQVINSEFFPDEQLLGPGRLTALGLINTPVLESSFGSVLYYRGRAMTKTDYINEFCRGNRFGCPTSLSPQVQQLYLRGEVQQNTLLRVPDAKFASIRDFKSSVGVELRVQVPIVNVPFRLIYFYNPNAKIGFTEELPGIFLPGKRNGFRFTVGRTF
jgi:outer membrane protein insertion porin family